MIGKKRVRGEVDDGENLRLSGGLLSMETKRPKFMVTIPPVNAPTLPQSSPDHSNSTFSPTSHSDDSSNSNRMDSMDLDEASATDTPPPPVPNEPTITTVVPLMCDIYL